MQRYRGLTHPDSLSTWYRIRGQVTGHQPWVKLWHHLRASCETDLMKHHPLHVVCKWIDNSPTVAERHYLMVQDEDFENAINQPVTGAEKRAQNPAQILAESLPERN